MKDAALRMMPRVPAGLTQKEMIVAAAEAAPKGMFPGTKANWWTKYVQLDLRAQGILAREGANRCAGGASGRPRPHDDRRPKVRRETATESRSVVSIRGEP